MKVLVTGSNGQVGTALIRALADEPFQTIPISRQQWDMRSHPSAAQDLVDRYSPNVVVNAAAYTDVDGAENGERTFCLA